jgi:hypothetical protein
MMTILQAGLSTPAQAGRRNVRLRQNRIVCHAWLRKRQQDEGMRANGRQPEYPA